MRATLFGCCEDCAALQLEWHAQLEHLFKEFVTRVILGSRLAQKRVRTECGTRQQLVMALALGTRRERLGFVEKAQVMRGKHLAQLVAVKELMRKRQPSLACNNAIKAQLIGAQQVTQWICVDAVPVDNQPSVQARLQTISPKLALPVACSESNGARRDSLEPLSLWCSNRNACKSFANTCHPLHRWDAQEECNFALHSLLQSAIVFLGRL